MPKEKDTASRKDRPIMPPVGDPLPDPIEVPAPPGDKDPPGDPIPEPPPPLD